MTKTESNRPESHAGITLDQEPYGCCIAHQRALRTYASFGGGDSEIVVDLGCPDGCEITWWYA